MDTMRICPGCQEPLSPNAPDGLCPRCLIKAGLGTGMDIGPDSQTESGPGRFVAPTADELAKRFTQLEILGFVGQGGMGAVYKARQKALDRVVALKILPPGISKDPAFAERFAREARAMAKLNHPGIVTLYEFGQADGLFFFLMEFVDGVNLRHLLEAGRLSPREALAIVPQICDALQYAHDQGIVHRDIKPENILLDRQGRVKVADFGLAKLVGTEGEPSAAGGVVAGSVVLTEAGKVMGTPQYMAPEQMGTPATVDHRADVYSLGVVFYQMLTGELPGKPIESPSCKVQIDVRLDEVVLRALEQEPERRYQQVSQVKTAVETIAQSRLPVDASPPPADWRTWSPFQSRQVREICAHMTEAERREGALRGMLFGIWNAATFFVPLGIVFFAPKPLNWIFAPTVLLIGLAFYPFWQRIMREFLASTIWAKQQGIAPESLRMWAHIILVGRRGGKAVIHWPGALLNFVLMLVVMEVAVIGTSLLLEGRINPIAVLIAFFFLCMITGLRIGRERAMPVDRLVALDEPAATTPPTATALKKSEMVRILEILFGFTFTSPLAIKLITFSAFGFLGALAFLGFVPLPGWHGCFGFAGFGGFFGLIGVAFMVESAQRRKAKQTAGSMPLFVESAGRRRLYWPGVLLLCGTIGLVVGPVNLAIALALWLLNAPVRLTFQPGELLLMLILMAACVVMRLAALKLGAGEAARAGSAPAAKVSMTWKVIGALLALDGLIVWLSFLLRRLLVDFYANPAVVGDPRIDPPFVTRLANDLAHQGVSATLLTIVTVLASLVVDIFIIRPIWRAAKKPLGGVQPAAATEEIRRRVKMPAIGLLVTGILNWILVPVIVLLISYWLPRTNAPRGSGLALAAASVHTLLFSSLMIFGALKMKRLASHNWGVSAAVLAIIVLPGNIIGLPLGIWALVVLARPEVRAGFRRGG